MAGRHVSFVDCGCNYASSNHASSPLIGYLVSLTIPFSPPIRPPPMDTTAQRAGHAALRGPVGRNGGGRVAGLLFHLLHDILVIRLLLTSSRTLKWIHNAAWLPLAPP